MNKIVNTLALTALFAACTADDTHLTISPELQTAEKKVTVIPVADLSTYGITAPARIAKQGSALAVGHLQALHHVTLVDLSTRTVRPWLLLGDGPNEAYMVSNFDVNPQGELSAFDCYTGKLHRHTSSPVSKTTLAPLSVDSVPLTHLSVVQGADFILSTGLYEQGRYRYHSLADSSVHYFIDYPTHPDYPNLSPKAAGKLWASTVLRLRPDQKAFVCADIRSGQIDICRLKGNTITLVRRHCYHYPHVDIQGENAEKGVAYYADNIHGFRDVAVSDERIYVLHSGRTYRDHRMGLAHCPRLLIFDWEGTLLATHALPQMTTYIAFDTEERALYGTTPDARLIRFHL